MRHRSTSGISRKDVASVPARHGYGHCATAWFGAPTDAKISTAGEVPSGLTAPTRNRRYESGLPWVRIPPSPPDLTTPRKGRRRFQDAGCCGACCLTMARNAFSAALSNSDSSPPTLACPCRQLPFQYRPLNANCVLQAGLVSSGLPSAGLIHVSWPLARSPGATSNSTQSPRVRLATRSLSSVPVGLVRRSDRSLAPFSSSSTTSRRYRSGHIRPRKRSRHRERRRRSCRARQRPEG